MTSRPVMDSPSEAGSAPSDALRASLLAARKSTLRRFRRDGGDDAGHSGAVDEADERPDVSPEADTERALADNGVGDLEAVEAISVAAAVAAAQNFLDKEEAGAERLASDKASDDDGCKEGDKNYADECLAFNEASTVMVCASASGRRVSKSTFKERGTAASDVAGIGTKTAAAGLSSAFLEGDKKNVESAAVLDGAGTRSKRKAADGLFQGEGMHGRIL